MVETPHRQTRGSDERPTVPRSDVPTSAGIAPAGASSLRRCLADCDRETATFEVSVADGRTDTTRYCWSVSLVDRGDDEAAPVRCVPLAPGEPTFHVDVDDIVVLNVVDLPPERFLAGAETPSERATAHRRLATAAPETVPVSKPLGLLDRRDVTEVVQRDATRSLREIARCRPADCTPAVPVLRSWIDGESFAGTADALATLRAIGEEDPGTIATATESIVSALSAPDAAARQAATGCVVALAGEVPEDVVEAVPDLAAIAEETGDTASLAVTGLSRIAAAHPDEVRPHAATLRTILLDDTRPDAARLSASAGIGRLLTVDPDLGVDLVDDLVSVLEDDDGRLRSNVAGILCDVAMVHTDVVATHVDALAPLLDADEVYARVNASGALGRVAADFPDVVAHHHDAFVDLLADEDARVRENACWTLGRIGTAETREALESVARTDDHERVRKRASWAVRNIDTESQDRAPTDT
jgi:hypothetical protein